VNKIRKLKDVFKVRCEYCHQLGKREVMKTVWYGSMLADGYAHEKCIPNGK